MKLLFQTLNQRMRPEEVAEMIVDILADKLDAKERKVIEKATRNSLKNNLWGYTQMAQEFAGPIGAKRQMDKACELFDLKTIHLDPDKTNDIVRFIEIVSDLLNKTVGQNNFLSDRQNKEERKAAKLELSKRAYNKRWRLLKRLEKKLIKYTKECTKSEFQKIAKHGIIHHVQIDEFVKDDNSACFVAYYTARCNLRCEFTIHGQQRSFDEISQMLFERCKKSSNTNWNMIAHVFPSIEVLAHLTDQEKGILLGKWTNILQNISSLLKELWITNKINRQTMIVSKGNDSTTWNNTAGAWNKARDNWMNLIYSMGLEDILDTICFGKVLRLMAADVVAWHKQVGNKLDPNTEVWNQIALPWEVFEGIETCNRQLIMSICKDVKISPEKSGWIAPRVQKVVHYRPTPELVHGVTVSNPFLAKVLKQKGYFSGK